MVVCKYHIVGNFRGVKISFNSKTVIFVSKNVVEVSLLTKITNILPPLYIRY